MVVILVDKISPRINYTFKQVFESFLNCPFKIQESAVQVSKGNAFIINYSSNENVISNLRIIANGLLLENDIKNIEPSFSIANDEVKLFLNESPIFGFDLFSAIFWLISRYEEYNISVLDNHNRFQAKESFAFKQGFLELPVVDSWLNQLSEIIERNIPGLIPKNKFSIVNTIDVDNAFAFKGKDFARKIGAFSRDLLKGKLAINKKRADVLSGKQDDPYDTYAYIKEQTIPKNINSIFFHLVGEKSKHDRNIKVNSPVYKTLLHELNEWSVQGLHPSYASNSIDVKVKEEKAWIEESTGKPILNSRQHFLMMSFPKTYNSLIAAGIQHDYSMGFADEIGFRAGTSRPFKFFDLVANKEKELSIHPFCLMDGTLRDYLKLTTTEAKVRVRTMLNRLKNMNLIYIAIWHNETLSETNGWEGWREVYELQFE